jgi:hypothetical protein
VTYAYSARNLLVEPHHYMYAPFEGAPLLDAFFQARRQVMRQLDGGGEPSDRGQVMPIAHLMDRNLALRCPVTHQMWRQELGDAALFEPERDLPLFPAESTVSFERFSVETEVKTSALLEAMLVASVPEKMVPGKTVPTDFEQSMPVWLDRVIQRFEVTKRLYESYQPGFRKGCGDYQSPQRYWLFALILSLSLSREQRLKHLNVLLKVCDLLCSMSATELKESAPAGGMQIVLAMELASIGALIKAKRVAYAA